MNGTAAAVDSPAGLMPAEGSIDMQAAGVTAEQARELFAIDSEAWSREAKDTARFLSTFKPRTPAALWKQFEDLQDRLGVPGEGRF